MGKICRHCFVSGTVQGVFYRHSTKEQAELRNLSGWAKNLPDGRVEVLVCGNEEQVLALVKWLHTGPERAIVTDVQVIEIKIDESLIGFNIIR